MSERISNFIKDVPVELEVINKEDLPIENKKKDLCTPAEQKVPLIVEVHKMDITANVLSYSDLITYAGKQFMKSDEYEPPAYAEDVSGINEAEELEGSAEYEPSILDTVRMDKIRTVLADPEFMGDATEKEKKVLEALLSEDSEDLSDLMDKFEMSPEERDAMLYIMEKALQ